MNSLLVLVNMNRLFTTPLLNQIFFSRLLENISQKKRINMFGRLGEQALKHDWIEYMAGVMMFACLIGCIVLITRLGKWKWLWKEWLTSVDHKKIGIMYLVVSFIMLAKGFIDALMMRAQQAVSF